MKAKSCILMHIWTQTYIFNTANLPQKSTVESISYFAVWSFRFLQIICRLFKHYCMYKPTGCIRCRHTHPHTHTTPITSLPRQRAVGAGQRRQSIDWAQRRRRRRRKEPQAMSSRGGEDLSEISAPWAFLPHMGKTRAQTAATALCSRLHRTLRGRMLTVQRPHCQVSNSVHFSLISSIRLLEIEVHSLKEMEKTYS